MNKPQIVLKYIGKGRWLPGAPARDLNKREVQAMNKKALLATGLYVEVGKRTGKSTVVDVESTEGDGNEANVLEQRQVKNRSKPTRSNDANPKE